MVKFVTFGETMAQYNASYDGPFKEGGDYVLDCAGAESNVALDLLKLEVPGIDAVWVSRLGDDEAGDFILRELAGRVQVAARKHPGGRTGVSYLNHLGDGQHVKTYRRKGSAASRLTFDEISPLLDGADVLHLTGITPALSPTSRKTVFQALRYAKDQDVPVSFDLNYRDQLWTSSDARAVVDDMIPYASMFKLGHDEAETVWGKGWSPERYAEHFQSLCRGVVVVTRGMDGAVAFDGDNLVDQPGLPVEVLDPVGAGDAFVAGFLGSIFWKHTLRGFLALSPGGRLTEMRKALEIGNVCGALTCTRQGDTAAMPTMDEVREFMAGSRSPA